MKPLINFGVVLGCTAMLLFAGASSTWAETNAQGKIGLQQGGRGLVHLQEMIALLEHDLKNSGAGFEKKQQENINIALKHAREALGHYDQALVLAAESMGVENKNPARKSSGMPHEESLKEPKEIAHKPHAFKEVPLPERPKGMMPLPGYEGS